MDGFLLIRGLAALIFTLSLIGGFAFLAKRFGLLQQMRPGRQMQVLESLPLDARTKLVMCRVGDRARVALVGANGCQFLNEDFDLPPAPEMPQVDAEGSNVIGWQAALQKAWTDRRAGGAA